ncbi:hypothetical protein [Mangrovibacterium diazotrophicum]|uniref:Uncharacterized protein n=1 Tax=Mangrovibacterium diazotrophicum TaxID=1261403 RepID=A0A419VW96_9BACT|nr:hypothetical protein [Mangrovibacterium diazotrophicum]RKD86388.1 hypothetical protein BC643_4079 [Mangrovibacterium diazotrophicum]
MNKLIKTLPAILLTCLTLFGLDNEINAQTQAKLELKWAKENFKENYQTQLYPRFTGKIIKLDSNSYKFDEKTLIIDNPSDELKYLLENGIFYPGIITGNIDTVTKTKQELDSLSESQRLFYNMSRTDSLRISDFEELKSIEKSPKQRRFKFYLFRLGFMNPQICFIELTNEKAKKDFSLGEFIKDCNVTYFKKGSILL